MKKNLILALFGLLLAACGSQPTSYLPQGKQPIVNVEQPLASQVKVSAEALRFKVSNQSEQPLNVQYKLFWYDHEGVTQTFDASDRTPWHNFWLEARASAEMSLTQPTPESVNYRLYLRHAR